MKKPSLLLALVLTPVVPRILTWQQTLSHLSGQNSAAGSSCGFDDGVPDGSDPAPLDRTVP